LSANSAALPSLSGNLSQGFPHFSPVAHKSGGRRPLPAHLERIEEVIEPAALACPSGACARVKIGEDVSERLDVVAPKFRVIVTRRPRYACTACRESVIQAPAPARLIEGGIATERLLAAIVVSKYADGLPLYRQETIFARESVELGRNLMTGWMGHVGFHLEPLAERLFELIRAVDRIFADETTLPVLAPGRGRTRTGYLWTYLRDDRPWGGAGPPTSACVDNEEERTSWIYAIPHPSAGISDCVTECCGDRDERSCCHRFERANHDIQMDHVRPEDEVIQPLP
jgi:transposase